MEKPALCITVSGMADFVGLHILYMPFLIVPGHCVFPNCVHAVEWLMPWERMQGWEATRIPFITHGYVIMVERMAPPLPSLWVLIKQCIMLPMFESLPHLPDKPTPSSQPRPIWPVCSHHETHFQGTRLSQMSRCSYKKGDIPTSTGRVEAL